MSVRRVASLSLAILLSGIVGCGPSEEMQQRLQELELAAAQKDSLVQEIADIANFMSDVNAELASVQLEGVELAQIESPVQASRDSVLTKIRVLNTRFDESTGRLASSRRRIRSLTQVSDSLRATLEQTITNYEQMIASNREAIAALTDQVESLAERNVQLAAAVDTLEAATSTVYYVIGTEDELLERGIIRKEGGSRVLFIFGKRGQTLVPARELDPADFTPIDKWEMTQIPLPDSTAQYRIASLQNLEYLMTPRDDKGRIKGRGSLEIGTPEPFWMPSKFLIVVEG